MGKAPGKASKDWGGQLRSRQLEGRAGVFVWVFVLGAHIPVPFLQRHQAKLMGVSLGGPEMGLSFRGAMPEHCRWLTQNGLWTEFGILAQAGVPDKQLKVPPSISSPARIPGGESGRGRGHQGREGRSWPPTSVLHPAQPSQPAMGGSCPLSTHNLPA